MADHVRLGSATVQAEKKKAEKGAFYGRQRRHSGKPLHLQLVYNLNKALSCSAAAQNP